MTAASANGVTRPTVGVLLMTFGSPATLEDVPAYMAHVRGRPTVSDELIAEFQRRYRIIGGSPLIAITRRQAAALEVELNRQHPDGPRFVVSIGMRHSPPFIADAIADFADRGIDDVITIILSPQYSPYIMSGYHKAVDEACAAVAAKGGRVRARVAGAWHLNPLFLDALADRVREALARIPEEARATVPVLLTCHSLPKRVVDREPDYLKQIADTIDAIVERVGFAPGQWLFAYQSAGHTAEEWLTPDMKDLLPGLRAQGHEHVLMVPVQFLSDHLEILYDIDVAAREDAEKLGLHFHRIESLNLSPKFIGALADVANGMVLQPA
jgi:ferrochelatase